MIDERLALAHDYLVGYATEMNPNFLCPPHIVQIADALHKVMDGSIKRLIITEPPRHGKSEIVSRIFPAFYHGHFPERFIIEATYAQGLASGFGAIVRDQLLDPHYREIFAETQLQGSSKAKDNYATTAGGRYLATSVDGTVTGHGAHLFIIDDPLKNRKQAESKVYREAAKDFFKSVAYTRLEPKGAVVVMMTRWHEDDLVGWLLREKANEGWTVLSLPAISDDGNALWPDRYPIEVLKEIQYMLGTYEWEALYQQRPTKKQGNVLKREWWNYWSEFPKCTIQSQSWDMAFKNLDDNDFVVGQVWGGKGANRYLLDQVRARMSFTETIEAFRRLTRKWPKARAKYVEEKANGAAVIDSLKDEISGIIAINPDQKGNKLARAVAVTPDIKAGNVFLPDPEAHTWVYGLIDRCAAFKGVDGDVDDEIDAMTQALSEMGGEAAERLRRLLTM